MDLLAIERSCLRALDDAAAEYVEHGSVSPGAMTLLRELDYMAIVARHAADLGGRKLRRCVVCGCSIEPPARGRPPLTCSATCSRARRRRYR